MWWQQKLGEFVTLLLVINPLGLLPVFLSGGGYADDESGQGVPKDVAGYEGEVWPTAKRISAFGPPARSSAGFIPKSSFAVARVAPARGIVPLLRIVVSSRQVPISGVM